MDQNSQPTPQPPYGNMVAPQPKKKKTGLIVGITLGVLAIVAIIAALLTYFLWWQNPEKMVTDAISNIATTKKITANGKIAIDIQDKGKLEFNLKSNTASGKSKADIDVKISMKGIEKKIPLKGDVILDSNGDIYVKINNFRDAYGSLLEATMESSSNGSMSKSQIEANRDEILGRIDSEIKQINDKWMKISPNEIDGDYKCVANVLNKLQSDEGARKEIAQLYQKNSFYSVKDSRLSDRNGGRGFELHVDSGKASKFEDDFKNSSIGKKFGECGKSQDDYKSDSEPIKKSPLKLWVDRWSHELRAIEIKSKSDKDSVEISFDVSMNKSEEVKIPSDAGSLKEFIDGFVSGYLGN